MGGCRLKKILNSYLIQIREGFQWQALPKSWHLQNLYCWIWRQKVRKNATRDSQLKASKSTYFGGAKWCLGRCSLMEGKWPPFWGKLLHLGANLSLLWVHYHFRLAFVHFIKSTKKSWHGSDPPPFLGVPGFWQCLSLQPLPFREAVALKAVICRKGDEWLF